MVALTVKKLRFPISLAQCGRFLNVENLVYSIQTRVHCFTAYPNWKISVENSARSGVLRTNFEVSYDAINQTDYILSISIFSISEEIKTIEQDCENPC